MILTQNFETFPKDMKNNMFLRPPLKWAGGKRWLVKHLYPIWEKHSHRRLIEPLCGGLAVTFGLLPELALLNDINLHLINFYKWLKKGLRISISMENDKDCYYAYRKEFNGLIQNRQTFNKKAAELFYYLNRTGYNGLCRLNSSGEFNVPFGKYKKITYTKDFTAYIDLLTNWEFQSKDFEELELQKNDFVYADPPYDVEFTQYAKENFRWEDQIRLVKWLSKHSGPIVLSNQATKRIVKLYELHGFTLQFLSAPRMISCTGDRTPAMEVLATKGI